MSHKTRFSWLHCKYIGISVYSFIIIFSLKNFNTIRTRDDAFICWLSRLFFLSTLFFILFIHYIDIYLYMYIYLRACACVFYLIFGFLAFSHPHSLNSNFLCFISICRRRVVAAPWRAPDEDKTELTLRKDCRGGQYNNKIEKKRKNSFNNNENKG